MQRSGDRINGIRITVIMLRSTVMKQELHRVENGLSGHLPVQGYVKMAGEGRYMDALKLIKHENPFPAVCGAICNKRCEEACTRATIDQAVAIDEINHEQNARRNAVISRSVRIMSVRCSEEKIAVIGAGPAGMSAAYYLRTKGYRPLFLNGKPEPEEC